MLIAPTVELAYNAPPSIVFANAVKPTLAGDPAAGAYVFSGNCAACHSGGMNVISPEKTLERKVSGFNQRPLCALAVSTFLHALPLH
jgi:mono/diheme cytochrome c family protein